MLVRTAIAVAALLLFAELAVREAIDLKLYGVDNEVGYWIQPGQSGGSLLTGSYVFNEQGFGVAEPLNLNGPRDIILVGDSLVFGTRELGQESLLGPIMEDITDWEVWPLATGSWGLANELRALERQDLTGAEAIVFIINSGDVKNPSFWRSDYDRPRTKPQSYLLYAIQKIIPAFQFSQKPIAVRQGDLRQEWSEFRSQVNIPVFVIGYDWKGTTGSDCDWMPSFIDEPLHCFDPIKQGLEDGMLDAIHLKAKGNVALARFIEQRLDSR